jgi:antitoxin ParD1/3/4
MNSQLKPEQEKFIQDKIAVGTEQIANGQLTDGEQVFARLQEKIS